MGEDGMTELAKKKSDLGVRTLSAIVMLFVAGGAFRLGGIWLDGFIALIALATYFELARLVVRGGFSGVGRVAGLVGGIAYVGLAAWSLINMEELLVFVTVLLVIVIDIAAYFSGRKFGNKKIAPSISPSKTWAGLYGAMVASGVFGFLVLFWLVSMAAAYAASAPRIDWAYVIVGTAIISAMAILAQAGDFFESWLKRRAGMKDSSNLIPGHGGFFDRVDGVIPVAIVGGILLNVLPI
jgi:phosphatidate cytidylyltransferase